MAKIKLIALDIDGTLVNSNNQLTPVTIQTIKQATAAGIKVVICTGRPLSGAQKLLQQLGLNNQTDQYVVCFGGAVAQTTNGNVLHKSGITYNDFCDLEVLARKLKLHFQVISPDRIYTTNRDIGYYTLYEANLVNLPVSYRTPEELSNVPLIKGMFIDDQAKLDAAIADQTPFIALSDRLTFTKTAPFYFEAYSKGTNKASALKALCKHLNITADEVMAVGDEANDLPMIKFAGIGVAMANAIPELKAAANYQTKDNDHDGVALSIKKWALSQE